MLGDYLKHDGFSVTLAHEGQTGIREALSGRHAIVVLDVMMPGVSGIEVLRQIRMSSQQATGDLAHGQGIIDHHYRRQTLLGHFQQDRRLH